MLHYLPVAIFGAVMGLSGLANTWNLSHFYFGSPLWIGKLIGFISTASFLPLVTSYMIKAKTSFDSVRAEFYHPIAGNLFATPLVSLLLLPVALADFNLALARAIWVVGVVTMSGFAWFTISRWMHLRQQFAYPTPAWFEPVVGMINIPLALPALHWYAFHGISVSALTVGFFFRFLCSQSSFHACYLNKLCPPRCSRPYSFW